MKYIDVSAWQGKIDWETAKPHIDGAILRAGHGTYIDEQFTRNAAECNRLGIPIGAYWFSEAGTVEEARAEAKALLAAVRPYRMELPLAYDFEEYSVKVAASRGITVTRQLALDMLYAFCETVEKGGYWALFYSNPNCITKYLTADVSKRFGLWLAQWPGGKPDVRKPPRPCAIWQWGGIEIPGITPGKTVDTNESYQDFKKIITAAGMNRLGYAEDDGSVVYEHTQAQPQKPWYADAMAWMLAQGLFTEERPNDPVTRAELATVLYRLCGPQDEKSDSGLLSD